MKGARESPLLGSSVAAAGVGSGAWGAPSGGLLLPAPSAASGRCVDRVRALEQDWRWGSGPVFLGIRPWAGGTASEPVSTL